MMLAAVYTDRCRDETQSWKMLQDRDVCRPMDNSRHTGSITVLSHQILFGKNVAWGKLADLSQL